MEPHRLTVVGIKCDRKKSLFVTKIRKSAGKFIEIQFSVNT